MSAEEALLLRRKQQEANRLRYLRAKEYLNSGAIEIDRKQAYEEMRDIIQFTIPDSAAKALYILGQLKQIIISVERPALTVQRYEREEETLDRLAKQPAPSLLGEDIEEVIANLKHNPDLGDDLDL